MKLAHVRASLDRTKVSIFPSHEHFSFNAFADTVLNFPAHEFTCKQVPCGLVWVLNLL